MILVTGCLGYIGKKIVKALLENGNKVRGLVLKKQQSEAEELENLGMEVFIGDLLCEASLIGIGRDIDIVFHLAGMHSSIRNMVNLYVNGTEALFRALEGYPIKRFIFSSNSSIYGSYITNSTVMAEETSFLILEHPFAEITKDAEEVIRREARKKDIKGIILRIGEVYDDGKYNILHKLQFPFSLLGNGENYVSLIHVEDLINILMLSMVQLEEGTYNVCDSCPCVQMDLYKHAAQISGGYVPKWIGYKGIEDRVLQSIHGLKMLSIKMSNHKLCQSTGYRFCYPSYTEGLRSLLCDERQAAI